MKLETRSPVRSFKHRGALAAVDRIVRDTDAHTIVTASTGNHGQGVAYAAAQWGLKTVVYVPEGAIYEKLRAMRDLGATVKVRGSHLGESQEAALSQTGLGCVYLEDGENPDLMAGAASVAWEILDGEVDIDTIIVPIGGGNLIGGSALARAHRNEPVEIVGVQSTAASGATESWLSGRVLEAPCDTFAGGLATTRPGTLALAMMMHYVESVILVDDRDLYRAIGGTLTEEGLALEGAAAAPIAALNRFGNVIPGDRVAVVITGDWLSQSERAKGLQAFSRTEE